MDVRNISRVGPKIKIKIKKKIMEDVSKKITVTIDNDKNDNKISNIIDGNAISSIVRDEVKKETEKLAAEYGIIPGLAVVLVGSRKDSETYVRMKKKVSLFVYSFIV